jgi:hypothetical protein
MARLSFGLIAIVTPTLWAGFAAAIEDDKHNLRALLGSKKPTMVDVICPAKIISVPEVGWQNLPEAKGCVKVTPTPTTTPTTTPTNVCKEVTASSSWLLAPQVRPVVVILANQLVVMTAKKQYKNWLLSST